MADSFTSIIEQATGRKVRTFLSETNIDDDVSVRRSCSPTSGPTWPASRKTSRTGPAAAAPPPWGVELAAVAIPLDERAALVQMLSLGWGVIHGPTRVWLQLPCGSVRA